MKKGCCKAMLKKERRSSELHGNMKKLAEAMRAGC